MSKRDKRGRGKKEEEKGWWNEQAGEETKLTAIVRERYILRDPLGDLRALSAKLKSMLEQKDSSLAASDEKSASKAVTSTGPAANRLQGIGKDLMLSTLTFLDGPSLQASGAVSRLFSELTREDRVWHSAVAALNSAPSNTLPFRLPPTALAANFRAFYFMFRPQSRSTSMRLTCPDFAEC